jgi:hypothetical protein
MNRIEKIGYMENWIVGSMDFTTNSLMMSLLSMNLTIPTKGYVMGMNLWASKILAIVIFHY